MVNLERAILFGKESEGETTNLLARFLKEPSLTGGSKVATFEIESMLVILCKKRTGVRDGNP